MVITLAIHYIKIININYKKNPSSRIDMQTMPAAILTITITVSLTFDLLTSGSMHAQCLP